MKLSPSRDLMLKVLSRLWWALLIALHVPAVVSVFEGLVAEPTVGRSVAAVAVAITVAIFVLKLIDVPFLRLGGHRRSALVFVLACSIAHHEVIAKDAAGEVTDVVPAVLVTGGFALVFRGLRTNLLRELERAWQALFDLAGRATTLELALVGSRDDAAIHAPPALVPCALWSRGPPC